MLDTRIGRWWSVDPKVYPWESSYISMGNNPILNTDILGDIVDGDKKGMKRYNKLKGTVNKKIAKYQAKVNDGKTKFQSDLNKWQAISDEYSDLEASSTTYFINSDVTFAQAGTQGRLNFDKNTEFITVNLSKDVLKWKSTLAHEMKHAFQYETGKVSLWYNNGQGSVLTDLTDEVEAYKRGALFTSDYTESQVNFAFVRARGYLSPAKDLNFKSTHQGLTSCTSYREVMRETNKNMGLANRKPQFIYKGWKDDYNSGKAERISTQPHQGTELKGASGGVSLFKWDF